MFTWIRSKNGKYLYAKENPSIRADLNGNVYGGGAVNYGTQTIQFNYYDPLNSDHFDQRDQAIRPRGVYEGGQVDRVDDTHVKINPLVVEISDGSQQARVKTVSAQNIVVASGTPFVVLRWAWNALTTNYMDMLALAEGSVLANDIVIAECIYAGAVLTSIEYSPRPVDTAGDPIGTPRCPNTLNQLLKVVPITVAGMYVFVNPGWVSYGASRIPVKGGVSPLIATPTLGRIDLIYIDAAGNIAVQQGGDAGSPTPPAYTNLIVLAELHLEAACSVITADKIIDARGWLTLPGAGGLTGITSAFITMGA